MKLSDHVLIEIDDNSGFCFGVVNAIQKAEASLCNLNHLYCLGDIVHNTQEVFRLSGLGLETIDHNRLHRLQNVPVLLRAHGEPPETYQIAQKNNIRIIDASCPVVLQLQRKIKQAYEKYPDCQIVIYGKRGHAEVNGLVGQTENRAIVIEHIEEAENLDFKRGIILFSQTTMSVEGFRLLVELLRQKVGENLVFEYNDTICRQVANRTQKIRNFAVGFELVFFVSDTKSSNGKVLFEECKKVNPNVHFISSEKEIDETLLKNVKTIGICGATSTPKWLMENVARELKIKLKKK